VMGVIEILSRRREYTKASPFVVLLGKGEHEVTSSWTFPGGVCQTTLNITRSNISFVGQGIGETIILGGISIPNVQNITLKQMTLTNTNGRGIFLLSSEVALVDVATINCHSTGIMVHIYVWSAAAGASQLVATRCEMSNNHGSGLHIFNSNNNISPNVCLKNCISHHNSSGISSVGKGVIHLYGEATAIHSNRINGIHVNTFGKVVIHLPSNHNTLYNNTHGDRFTIGGGTITNVHVED